MNHASTAKEPHSTPEAPGQRTTFNLVSLRPSESHATRIALNNTNRRQRQSAGAPPVDLRWVATAHGRNALDQLPKSDSRKADRVFPTRMTHQDAEPPGSPICLRDFGRFHLTIFLVSRLRMSVAFALGWVASPEFETFKNR